MVVIGENRYFRFWEPRVACSNHVAPTSEIKAYRENSVGLFFLRPPLRQIRVCFFGASFL